MNFGNTFGLFKGALSAAVATTPPIVGGDFILYSYDHNDELGWAVDPSNGNVVVDSGVGTTSRNGAVYASNAVYLTTGQYVDIPLPITYKTITYMSPLDGTVTTIVGTGSTYRLTESFCNLLVLDSPFTASDITYLEANPNSLVNMVVTNMPDFGYGFTLSNIVNFYPANEGEVGGAFVQDITKPSEAVEIINYMESTRTVYKNTRFGINDLRLIKDSSGRVENIITIPRGYFDGSGRVIDTGVTIDGSLTDFSIVMAFTLADGVSDHTVNHYLANTGSDINRLRLEHLAYQPVTDFVVQIGQYVDVVVFDNSIPGAIHAMIAVFDKDTSTLMIAIDGATLSTPFPIVFDGPVGPVLLGAGSIVGTEPYHGYIGEGIQAASKVTQAEWDAYWTSLNNIVP